MKKLSLYIFLILMVCNVGFANQVLLECEYKKGNDTFWGDLAPRDTHDFSYYLISSDFKTLHKKGIDVR